MLPNQQFHLSKLHYRRQELKNELEHLGKKKKKKAPADRDNHVVSTGALVQLKGKQSSKASFL